MYTQGTLFPALHHTISRERLKRYRHAPGDSDEDVLARYIWNMKLSEALYPTMQALEVGLRNNIHTAATAYFGTDMWFEPSRKIIKPQEFDSVHKAISKVRSNLVAGSVIAALNFGFWTSLMDRRYEKHFWRPIIIRTVPGMPKYMRTRQNLLTRFDQIRELRNRIFHHEHIWDWHFNGRDLVQQHQDIREAIGWVSPDLRGVINLYDLFPAIHAQGIAPYRAKLAAYRLTLPQ